jgi:hypothetical protein
MIGQVPRARSLRAATLVLLSLAGTGGCDAAPAPSAGAPPPASRATRPAASTQATASAYPSPQADYPPSRLHERVDGAAEVLIAAGCRRLLYWRLEDPPVDVEVLAFATDRGAREALGRDAGSDRLPGVPGDEGWAGDQVVYFKRGAAYARLVADHALPAGVLLAQARRLERALSAGELRP